LNEIEYAQELGKDIVPVVLEALEGPLVFEEFKPRFRRTQRYTATGDDEKDRQAIVGAIEAMVGAIG